MQAAEAKQAKQAKEARQAKEANCKRFALPAEAFKEGLCKVAGSLVAPSPSENDKLRNGLVARSVT